MLLRYRLHHAYSYIALKLWITPKRATEDDYSLLSIC